MYANGPICAQKLPSVYHMYRREHRDQLSFKDFFLPFGGQLSGDNRWIKLAELIRGTNWKMTMHPSSARCLELQRSHFAWRWEL
jgi:hypothetical protein